MFAPVEPTTAAALVGRPLFSSHSVVFLRFWAFSCTVLGSILWVWSIVLLMMCVLYQSCMYIVSRQERFPYHHFRQRSEQQLYLSFIYFSLVDFSACSATQPFKFNLTPTLLLCSPFLCASVCAVPRIQVLRAMSLCRTKQTTLDMCFALKNGGWTLAVVDGGIDIMRMAKS